MHRLDVHKYHVHQLTYHFETILIGDSIAAGLSFYSSVSETFFKKVLNFGINGDHTQHVLLRVECSAAPSYLKDVIIHFGTNNISMDNPT